MSPPASHVRRSLALGFGAGLMAGLLMLIVMAGLRLLAGVATPTEMIFNHLFPLLTVDFFGNPLMQAGGYTSLKLDGVYVELVGQLLVTGLAGVIYAWYLRRHAGRGGEKLVLPGVLAVTLLFIVLLWPDLLTSYRGLPPERATLLSSVGLLLSFTVCGLALMGSYRLFTGQTEDNAVVTARLLETGMGRRAFLAGGIGAGLAVVLGELLHRLYLRGTFSYDGRQYLGPGVQKITPIQPKDEFYEVSKNLVDPAAERSVWRLEITGQVDTPRTYTFAEIAAMPAVTQETTLLSIFYGVGSGLCSNARWKGVPLVHLLNEVKTWGNNAVILFHSADGYYETFRFDKALEPTTLLAYEMNGEPLPSEHGYPLRLIVPGLYGEKSAKWLTRLEVVDQSDPRLQTRHGLGFYREQGWDLDSAIPTQSRIDAPLVQSERFAEPFQVGKTAELRGMAFGGDRGISKVEISTDDGQHWAVAEIHQPGTRISWSLWRYRWTPAEPTGATRVIVRATDGNRQPQIAVDRPPMPSGATGLHRVRAQVKAAAV